MRKIIAVLALLCGTGAIGWGTIEHYAAAGVAKVGEVIESLKPVEVLISEALDAVEDVDEEHAGKADRIAVLTQELDGLRAAGAGNKAEIEVSRRRECKLKMLLAQDQKTYVFGGCHQPRAGIEARLAGLRAEIRQKQAEADRRDQRITDISQEVAGAQAWLAQLGDRRAALEEEIRLLKARLLEAELAAEAREMNAESSALVRDQQSGAARKIAAIRKRVEKVERRGGAARRDHGGGGTLSPAEAADLDRLFPEVSSGE